MAKVIWTVKADRLFDKYVFNAFLEYGQNYVTHLSLDITKKSVTKDEF